MDTDIKLTVDEAAMMATMLDIGKMFQDKVTASLRARLVTQIEQVQAAKKKESEAGNGK